MRLSSSLPRQKKALMLLLWVTAPNISAADKLNEAWSGSEEVIFLLAVVVSQSSQFVALSSAIVPTSPLPQINVRHWVPGMLQRHTCEMFRTGIQSGVVVPCSRCSRNPIVFPAEARDNPLGLISVTRCRWVPERRIDRSIEVAGGEMRCCAVAPAKPRLIEADVFYRQSSVSGLTATFYPTCPLTLSISAAVH